MVKKIIGIDLGGTTVKMALLSLKGDIEIQWSIPTNTKQNGKYIINDIIESIKGFLKKNGYSTNDIEGIGMGSPGQIDYEKGTVKGAFNLGWQEEQEVKHLFREAFNLPFFIDNDANVAALGERWRGAGKNTSDVVFITLGTGVGGGIVANGQLLHGTRGSAGEIGHMIVNLEGFQCTCGNRGCLETVASATGVVQLLKAEITQKDYESPLKDLLSNKILTAKDIFDAAKTGDKLALEVIDQFSTYLGLACSQLANALNPDFIVIGGGVSAAGNFLLKKVQEKFLLYAFPTVLESTGLALATLGNNAGIIGAASLVMI